MAYSYANQSQNRMPAIIAVGGIHAGLAALLIYGLATSGIIPDKAPPLVGGQIELPPPPPTPDPVETPNTETLPSSRDVVAPDPKVNIAPNPPSVNTSEIILPPTPPAPSPIPSALPTIAPPPPPPSPTPSFDPVQARPSNNPGGWVTQADYRSSWVNRGYDGQVGFRVSVGASGRVEGCSVTRSSGVSALDEATCQLVTRRARFAPAKNSQGRAVDGSYTGAVLWQLPD